MATATATDLVHPTFGAGPHTRDNPDQPMFAAGTPAKLFDARSYFVGDATGRTWDISPDGKAFLMVKEASADLTMPVVVVNWLAM